MTAKIVYLLTNVTSLYKPMINQAVTLTLFFRRVMHVSIRTHSWPCSLGRLWYVVMKRIVTVRAIPTRMYQLRVSSVIRVGSLWCLFGG
jgi:hypothetical protein